MFSILWVNNRRFISFCFVLFFINALITEALKECFPPSVPMNGTYGDVKDKYIVKDKVHYSCNEGFLLVGDSERTCLSNETWTGNVPFCDSPFPINRTSANHYFKIEDALKIIDKNSNTCLELGRESDYRLRIDLDAESKVDIVRLFLPKVYHLEALTESNSGGETCSTFNKILDEKQWKTMDCTKTAIANKILIRRTGNESTIENLERSDVMAWELCEVEFYTVDKSKCRYTPADLNLPRAQLQVSREKAMLKCDSSETEGRLYYVCENDKWNEAGGSTCEELKNSSLRNVIIIIAVAVSVTLGVLVIAVYIYRRRKNSILVLRQNELYGHPEMIECTVSADGSEYADLNYEEIPLPPVPKRIPGIKPTKMPDLLTEHVTEEHDVQIKTDSQSNIHCPRV